MSDYRRYRILGGYYFFPVNLLERLMDTLVEGLQLAEVAIAPAA
jgi:putative transposase